LGLAAKSQSVSVLSDSLGLAQALILGFYLTFEGGGLEASRFGEAAI
jgi:hypothetical protein